jgi:hypothetical protein
MDTDRRKLSCSWVQAACWSFCLTTAVAATDTPTARSVVVAARPTPQPEFSADIVSRDDRGSTTPEAGKLYVADGKIRIETPDAPDGYFLIDAAVGSIFFVRPAQRIFMDAKRSTSLTQIFIRVDPNDACRQWRLAEDLANGPGTTAASEPAWQCLRLETASANGSGQVEYRVESVDGKTSQRWVDPNLGVPIKARGADGATLALEHVQVGAQPANLLVVPPGYRKFDPQTVLDRIKHSDVWAERAPTSP